MKILEIRVAKTETIQTEYQLLEHEDFVFGLQHLLDDTVQEIMEVIECGEFFLITVD